MAELHGLEMGVTNYLLNGMILQEILLPKFNLAPEKCEVVRLLFSFGVLCLFSGSSLKF